jgi:TatD DNase family protein
VEPVIQQIREHAGQLAAMGEVGLDYWIAKEPEARQQQRAALIRLAALALELDLPLSVHSRSAGHHALGLLQECGARRVCMHAFDGAAKHAARAAEMGYLLSVPPSVVRSPQKQKLVQRVPLVSLMLETDSPVLGPDREQRNVPANVTVAADKIAEIKGCDLEQVLRVTSDNARRFFGLDRF